MINWKAKKTRSAACQLVKSKWIADWLRNESAKCVNFAANWRVRCSVASLWGVCTARNIL